LEGLSTDTEIFADAAGDKFPEAGAMWHQDWLTEAVQFKFALPTFFNVMVWTDGARPPEEAWKGKDVGKTFIIGLGVPLTP